MQNLNLPVAIQCPIHPSEVIQRVDLNMGAKKQVFCLDCALQSENPKALNSTLQTLPNFIASAAQFYSNHRSKVKLSNGPSSEHFQIIQANAENYKNLVDHIEQEKEKVATIFNEIITDIVENLNQKLNEILSVFDQQLANMAYHYMTFEKQIKKAYPTAEDIQSLYPSKQELEKIISQLSSAQHLEDFVKSVKADMNEDKLSQNLNSLDEKSKARHFNTVLKKLREQEAIKPVNNIENLNIKHIRMTLKKTLDKLFEKDNTIRDPITHDPLVLNYPEDSFISAGDFDLVKEWVPSKYKFELKLLYKSSTDGLDPENFHKKCDGKGPTLTFIRCQFHKSSIASIIGGYLDKDWHSRGDCIESKEAFIFSVTAKTKCPIINKEFAAYGGPRNGPRFGNCDIQTYANTKNKFDQTIMRPNSYMHSAKLVESESYEGVGEISFKLLDIEVYQIR